MATTVLEKQDKRLYADDTVPLCASIAQYRTVGSHVEYEIRVHKLLSPDNEWPVHHRYSDFATLHQQLSVSGVPLPLPPKKVFGNTERQFLQDRQTGLQKLLDEIARYPLLSTSLPVRRFLDPRGYAENFYESALRNVSMFFRSEPNWQVVEPLRDIGWRCRKQFYLITNKSDSRQGQHILSWCEPGPDFSLGAKELEAALKILGDIKHPHILPTVSATYNGVGVMVVRQFIPTGSLRDLIHGTRPQGHVIQKYCSPSSRPLQMATVKRYGRQVLEALGFLQDRGYVMGHVHAGNVLVDKSQVCKLVDIENSLLGVPSMYRAFLLEIRKIYTHEAETVYSFGHMLYEMSCGRNLTTALLEDQCLTNIPQAVVPVLTSILSAQGIKANLPTIADLIANPLFSDVQVTYIEKPTLKVHSKLKEVLKAHREKAEMHLHEQQRKLAHQRRVSRAQDTLMSDEQKKMRKKKLKKQMKSVDESSEVEAYPTTTALPPSTTIGTTSVSAPKQKSTSQSNGPTPSQSGTGTTKAKTKSSSPSPSAAPPPPQTQPPAPQQPSHKSNERGALLTSIEGFRKGKLKKAQTRDRSAPHVSR